MTEFKPNVELDARMVMASMKGGMDALMNFGFLHREYFPNTKDVTDRAKWLKTQSEDYIEQVSKKVVQLKKK